MFWNALAAYAVGFTAIQTIVHFALRDEPTSHGQIVGRQVGCVIGLLWPIALPYFLITGIGAGLRWCIKKLKDRMA